MKKVKNRGRSHYVTERMSYRGRRGTKTGNAGLKEKLLAAIEEKKEAKKEETE